MTLGFMNFKWFGRVLFALLALVVFASAHAAVYREPSDYVKTWAGNEARPDVVWVTGDLRKRIESILGHDFAPLRVRYWANNAKTVWILEEIGKHEPITTGVVVGNGRIQDIQVLIFRESRGFEVRYPFFTNQFQNAGLGNGGLDKNIDGISGATLSVRALKKLAQVALVLDAHVNAKTSP